MILWRGILPFLGLGPGVCASLQGKVLSIDENYL